VLRFPAAGCDEKQEKPETLGGGKSTSFEGSQAEIELEPNQALGLIVSTWRRRSHDLNVWSEKEQLRGGTYEAR
jgi:hypothetical protein